MASKTSNPWQTVSIHPLLTPLDTRSRPADIPAGALRWKQNFQVTPDSKLCRRSGHEKFYSDATAYTNYDLHHQGGTRQPITFMFESTTSDGVRRFYAGNQGNVWLLNEVTGLYSSVITGLGATGTRWKAAELQDSILFTNGHDPVFVFSPANPGIVNAVTIPDCDRAQVIIQWNGFLFVMNVAQGLTVKSSRVIWSDINRVDFSQGSTDPISGIATLAGFQDLDYGDDILAAAPLLNALYIFTRRSIWKVSVASDPNSVFAFTKVYSEPKNQTGCIAFPNTLVSTGLDLFYMGRDGIYRYNPYLQTPERDAWLYAASGLIYRKLDTQLDENFCLSPVAEYNPTNREIWISWPSAAGHDGINNWTLVAQVEQKTADIVDTGYTAFVNYRRTAASGEACNETQDFLGASGKDWAIKSIGGVLFREYVKTDAGGDLTVDVPDVGVYKTEGYYSILRGMIPLGLNDREKIVRSLLLDHDTSDEDVPCVVQLRIGLAFSLVDPNSLFEAHAPATPPNTDTSCAPLWALVKDAETGLGYKVLQCPDRTTLPEMQAKNLRPGFGMKWSTWKQATFLFFELTVANKDGSPATGGDSCWQRLDFDCCALPKP